MFRNYNSAILLIALIVLGASAVAFAQSKATTIQSNLVLSDLYGRAYTPTCDKVCDLPILFNLSDNKNLAPGRDVKYYIKSIKNSGIQFTDLYMEVLTNLQKTVNNFTYNCSPVIASNGTKQGQECEAINNPYNESYIGWQRIANFNTLVANKNTWYGLNIRGIVNPFGTAGGAGSDIVPKILGVDLPYAWWNVNYTYKATITMNYSANTPRGNVSYPINATSFNYGTPNQDQTVWIQCPIAGNCSNVLYFSNNSYYAVTDSGETYEVPMDVELGNSTSFMPSVVWTNNTNITLAVWHLSNLSDATGQVADLTVSGAGVFNTSGLIGNAYSQHTAGDHLYTPTPATWNTSLNYWRYTGNLTLIAVIHPDLVDTTHNEFYVDASSGGCGNNIMTFFRQSGDLWMHIDTNDCADFSTHFPVTYTAGHWYMIVGQFEFNYVYSVTMAERLWYGDLTTGTWTYLGQGTKAIRGPYTNIKPYFIGGRSDSPSAKFQGAIGSTFTV